MSDMETTTSAPESAEPKAKKRYKSKSPHAPSENGVVGPPRKKREEQADALIAELAQLRGAMDELIEHYRLRVGGEIAELAQTIRGNENSRPPSAKVTGALLRELRDKPFKPHKGRGKDLARLQNLVRRMSELLPAED